MTPDNHTGTDTDGQRPTEHELTAPLGLVELVREDWERHGRSFGHAGFQALALHRLGVRRYEFPPLLLKAASAAYKTLNRLLIRNVYGIEVHETTVIGRRVWIPHHVGVVLGSNAVIMEDTLVRQGVTLGRDGASFEHPMIGRRVTLGAGCTVAGGIRVGDDARIGPNAVVLRDVPDGASVFAPPSRVLPAPPKRDGKDEADTTTGSDAPSE